MENKLEATETKYNSSNDLEYVIVNNLLKKAVEVYKCERVSLEEMQNLFG